jgi:hypothetical protein
MLFPAGSESSLPYLTRFFVFGAVQISLKSMLVLCFWLLLSVPLCFARAYADVYKCLRGGVISYQDKPCSKGTAIGRVKFDPPPPAGSTPASSVRPPTPIPSTPPAPPAPALLAPAENYKCTQFDGKTYFSASLMPKRHFVPGYALNPPRSELAHVWVTDSCVAVPIKEACDYYNTEIDSVQRQARNAQNKNQASEKKALEREAQRLRTVSNSRCRG